MLIVSVVGARPNVIKLAPVARELATRADVEHVIVHTGRHDEPGMAATFFEGLWVPTPDYHLGVGSGSHAAQTAEAMQRLEPLLLNRRPDLVLVYGDGDSTVAAALTAAKLGVAVGHVDAGLRSRDWTMPEEIDRVVTDRLSQLLFAPSRDAVENLRREGINAESVHFIGNIVIDSLCWALPRAQALDLATRYGLGGTPYVVATLHHPSNVDDAATLAELVTALAELGRTAPVLFPVHRRTHERLGFADLAAGGCGALRLMNPMSYLEMVGLVAAAGLVVTDSGGLQEETTFLGVPCLTVRPHTERPVTCLHGTNHLVPPRREAILAAAARALAGRSPARPVIERWDGRAAERVARVLCDGVHYDADESEATAAPAPRRARRAVAVPQESSAD